MARELGLSDRTLQRRIDDDGTTFRKLLLEARQELAREYLNRPDIDVAEVAYLLGYEDSNSFYRAFRTWEGTTPSQLRQSSNDPLTRQQREVGRHRFEVAAKYSKIAGHEPASILHDRRPARRSFLTWPP